MELSTALLLLLLTLCEAPAVPALRLGIYVSGRQPPPPGGCAGRRAGIPGGAETQPPDVTQRPGEEVLGGLGSGSDPPALRGAPRGVSTLPPVSLRSCPLLQSGEGTPWSSHLGTGAAPWLRVGTPPPPMSSPTHHLPPQRKRQSGVVAGGQDVAGACVWGGAGDTTSAHPLAAGPRDPGAVCPDGGRLRALHEVAVAGPPHLHPAQTDHGQGDASLS